MPTPKILKKPSFSLLTPHEQSEPSISILAAQELAPQYENHETALCDQNASSRRKLFLGEQSEKAQNI